MKKYPSVVAVDFDETIGLFKPSKKITKTYQVKKVRNIPHLPVVRFIKKLRAKGVRVVVYTSRWWGDYNSLVEWFKKHKIKVDDILLGRFKADLYVCDKSVNPHHQDFEKDAFQLLNETDSWGKHYSKMKKKEYKNDQRQKKNS